MSTPNCGEVCGRGPRRSGGWDNSATPPASRIRTSYANSSSWGRGEDSLIALTIYPLVRVAWADGWIDERERETVLRAAAEIGCPPDTTGYHLLEVWLDERPDEKVHVAWRDYVHAILRTVVGDLRESMKRDVLARARRVAEAAGGILGIHRVSAAERTVLEELERELDEFPLDVDS